MGSGCAVLWACCWCTRDFALEIYHQGRFLSKCCLFISTLLSAFSSFPPCHASPSVQPALHIAVPQMRQPSHSSSSHMRLTESSALPIRTLPTTPSCSTIPRHPARSRVLPSRPKPARIHKESVKYFSQHIVAAGSRSRVTKTL